MCLHCAQATAAARAKYKKTHYQLGIRTRIHLDGKLVEASTKFLSFFLFVGSVSLKTEAPNKFDLNLFRWSTEKAGRIE